MVFLCQTNSFPARKAHGPGADTRPHKRAFTLVELLVTIAIIGILIAVLITGMSGALAMARKSGCISNLRQLGGAFHAYASENDENLPPNPDPSVTPTYFWMGVISPYLSLPAAQTPYSGPNALKCPAYSPKPEWQTYTLNANIYQNVVAPNFYTSVGAKMTRFHNISKLVLLFDGGDGAVADGWPDALTMVTYFVMFRHPGGNANFLMVDGSVSSYTKTSDISTDNGYWVP